ATMSYRPSFERSEAMMAASVPILRGTASPPTSSPSKISTTPNGSSCARQRPIISRYRGSKIWRASVASGNRTVCSGNNGSRTRAPHPAGDHKPSSLRVNVQGHDPDRAASGAVDLAVRRVALVRELEREEEGVVAPRATEVEPSDRHRFPRWAGLS